MPLASVTLFSAVRAVIAVTGIALLLIAAWVYRRHDGAGTRPFVLLLAVMGTIALADGIAAGDPKGLSVVWLVAYLAIPMAFAGFVVEYYGLPYLASWWQKAAFLAPAVLAVAGGAVIIFDPLMQGAMVGGGPPGVDPPTGIAVARLFEQMGLYYAGGAMILAAGLMLRTASAYEHLELRLGVALSFVAVWPWQAYMLTPAAVGRIEVPLIFASTATGYVLSTLAALYAVTRGGLFDAAPAAGTLGPETVLESLGDAVVVVDHDERVVRVNEAVAERFGVEAEEAVGRPLEAVIGADLATLDREETIELPVTDGTRPFEATVTPVTDRRGRTPGRAVVLSDVTRQRVRAQRLSVLNRVLRHNLRNEVTRIIGRAEVIADDVEGHADTAEGILATADDLVDLGERAQQVEEMMSIDVDPDARTDIETLVETVVGPFRDSHPDAAVTVDVPSDLRAAVDSRVLSRVLDNLVENALKHNDAPTPVVTVSARRDGSGSGPVQLSVSDNGPGLPEQERAVLEAGDESQLRHGSGLGLWAVSWGVTRMGGELSFADNEPTGTVVTMRLPAAGSEPGEEPAGAAVEAD